MHRNIYRDEHDQFRGSVRRFLETEVAPHCETWNREGIVSRELFTMAGSHGFLGIDAPAEFGGGGVEDFRFNAIVGEEAQRQQLGGASLALTLHNDICMPYFTDLTTRDQRARWLPDLCSGAAISAIAMTEPGAGSDLGALTTRAHPDGEGFVLNGSKTFITNGINADLVITAATVDPQLRHRGIVLVVVERGMPGFERGRKLDKLGLHSQDTAELNFTGVRVPAENVLGAAGEGFGYLMRNLGRERLSLAISALANAASCLEFTIEYCRGRQAFGRSIGSFQHNRFRLAEMWAEIEITQTFVDRGIEALNEGVLSAEDASIAKWWATELQGRVIDTCLQLHGGYGYMMEQPIARAYADARVTRIYGGTTEIMKEIVSRRFNL